MSQKFKPSYISAREDVLRLIPPTVRRVLDIGCSTGSLGAAIKDAFGAEVTGIEISPEMANVARKKLDQVYVGDILELVSSGVLSGERFDAIILADVLEHLVDPWGLLRQLHPLLVEQKLVVASIPNVRHLDTIYNLVVRGSWPNRTRGIHDNTHLRFFTAKDIKQLFDDTGFQINLMTANYRIIERPHKLNRYAHFLALPGLKPFLAYQYLISAAPK